MNGLVFFEHLGQMLTLFDDELLALLLARVELELGARGKVDARNYVARARRTLTPFDTPSAPRQAGRPPGI